MSELDTYDAGESFCASDVPLEEIDWDKVAELPAHMARVTDVDSALEFYDKLAGR